MTTITQASRPGFADERRLDGAARLRMVRAELEEAVLAIVREPSALFFSVAMPVGFFALFAAMWGGEQRGELLVGTGMLATFGTFGVVGVTLINPGVTVADDRERGWLRTKRLSGVPVGITLVAKLVASLPYALAVLVAMTAVAAATGTLEVTAGAWLRLAAVLVVGALPFALIGLTVGFLASPNAAVAILNAVYIPSAVASGLWMPLDQLPALMQRVAPALPTYHLAELGRAQLLDTSTAAGGHLLVLLATAGGAAVTAGFAYRHAPP